MFIIQVRLLQGGTNVLQNQFTSLFAGSDPISQFVRKYSGAGRKRSLECGKNRWRTSNSFDKDGLL